MWIASRCMYCGNNIAELNEFEKDWHLHICFQLKKVGIMLCKYLGVEV